MKTAILFLLCALPAFASEVKFAWNPSPTPDVSYTLTVMQGTNAHQKINVGSQTNAVLTLTNTAVVFVQALKDGLLSDPSNQVTWTPMPPAPPIKPGPPTYLRITLDLNVKVTTQ